MADTRAHEEQTLQALGGALWEAAVVMKVRKKDLMKWPEDIEALHQYRISIRVARSLAKFVRPYQRRAQNDELKLRLKRLQDPTSRMRELDVLVPQLEAGSPQRAAVEAARAANRAAFMQRMKTQETQDDLAWAIDALRHAEWRGRALREGIDAADLAGRIEAARLACEEALETVDFDDQEAVHDLRKRAKSLRYVSRELAGVLPEGAADTSSRMRKMQDKLGEWCDARVNASLVAQICGDAGVQLAQDFQAQAKAVMQELKDARARDAANAR